MKLKYVMLHETHQVAGIGLFGPRLGHNAVDSKSQNVDLTLLDSGLIKATFKSVTGKDHVVLIPMTNAKHMEPAE